MIKNQIESLLFVATKPLSAKELFNFIKKHDETVTIEAVKTALDELYHDYLEGRGLTLVVSEDHYQFVSNSENAELVKAFLKDDHTGELTQPSLETLTIVAYRGPVSKPVIEQIRGVNCTMILRNLLIRGLVTAEDRDNDTFYSVTTDFLKFLGIHTVAELPDYNQLHTVENLEQFLQNRTIAPVNEENVEKA
jgi:segregation and condensation protein B